MKNKKIIFGSIGILVGALILSIFAFVPIGKQHDDLSENWMSKVSDNTKITDMSIPGTHDSGATHSIADVSGKCQDSSIAEQLDMGVRFFDLRLQLVNNEFKIVHSFVDQKLSFETVLTDFHNFMEKNTSEFLLLSIKKEADNVDSNIDFGSKLLEDLGKLQPYISLNSKLPETLGEARGHIYILNRYNDTIGLKAAYGWADDTTFDIENMHIQDNYSVETVDVKWNDIESTIEYAKNSNDKLVFNFTSCYLNSGFPPTYAGTPAVTINQKLISTLKENDYKIGIMVVDFVSENLSKVIYERNIK